MHDSHSDTYTYATIKAGYDFHPMADIFPLMSRREFDELVADIDAHGQQMPIWTFKGSIIDGRNRYKACLKLNLVPMVLEWEGDEGELVPFIVSLNLRRRHLKAGQRATVAAKLANIALGDNQHTVGSANLQTLPPVSQAQAADLLNVSPRTVADAKTVQDKGSPELIAAVEQGAVSVSAAAEVAKEYAEEPAKQREIVEAGTVKEVAKKIKESKRTAESVPARPSEIIAAVIAEVETLSREFQDLDAKEMGARFASILDQLTDALHQLDRR